MTRGLSNNVKRVVAGICALSMVGGSVPFEPIAQFAKQFAVQASAVIPTATWSGDVNITDTVVYSGATLEADTTLTIAEGKTVTVYGGIIGGFKLTVKGGGTLIVNGTNGTKGYDGEEGGDGNEGGTGFVGDLVVDGATVEVHGGNGGIGGNGLFFGGIGGKGGNGVSGNVTVKDGSATVSGGNGGQGGTDEEGEKRAASGNPGKAVVGGTVTGNITAGSADGQTLTVDSVRTIADGVKFFPGDKIKIPADTTVKFGDSSFEGSDDIIFTIGEPSYDAGKNVIEFILTEPGSYEEKTVTIPLDEDKVYRNVYGFTAVKNTDNSFSFAGIKSAVELELTDDNTVSFINENGETIKPSVEPVTIPKGTEIKFGEEVLNSGKQTIRCVLIFAYGNTGTVGDEYGITLYANDKDYPTSFVTDREYIIYGSSANVSQRDIYGRLSLYPAAPAVGDTIPNGIGIIATSGMSYTYNGVAGSLGEGRYELLKDNNDCFYFKNADNGSRKDIGSGKGDIIMIVGGDGTENAPFKLVDTKDIKTFSDNAFLFYDDTVKIPAGTKVIFDGKTSAEPTVFEKETLCTLSREYDEQTKEFKFTFTDIASGEDYTYSGIASDDNVYRNVTGISPYKFKPEEDDSPYVFYFIQGSLTHEGNTIINEKRETVYPSSTYVIPKGTKIVNRSGKTMTLYADYGDLGIFDNTENRLAKVLENKGSWVTDRDYILKDYNKIVPTALKEGDVLLANGATEFTNSKDIFYKIFGAPESDGVKKFTAEEMYGLVTEEGKYYFLELKEGGSKTPAGTVKFNDPEDEAALRGVKFLSGTGTQTDPFVLIDANCEGIASFKIDQQTQKSILPELTGKFKNDTQLYEQGYNASDPVKFIKEDKPGEAENGKVVYGIGDRSVITAKSGYGNISLESLHVNDIIRVNSGSNTYFDSRININFKGLTLTPYTINPQKGVIIQDFKLYGGNGVKPLGGYDALRITNIEKPTVEGGQYIVSVEAIRFNESELAPSTWSEKIPADILTDETNVYTVWAKVQGDATHLDSAPVRLGTEKLVSFESTLRIDKDTKDNDKDDFVVTDMNGNKIDITKGDDTVKYDTVKNIVNGQYYIYTDNVLSFFEKELSEGEKSHGKIELINDQTTRVKFDGKTYAHKYQVNIAAEDDNGIFYATHLHSVSIFDKDQDPNSEYNKDNILYVRCSGEATDNTMPLATLNTGDHYYYGHVPSAADVYFNENAEEYYQSKNLDTFYFAEIMENGDGKKEEGKKVEFEDLELGKKYYGVASITVTYTDASGRPISNNFRIKDIFEYEAMPLQECEIYPVYNIDIDGETHTFVSDKQCEFYKNNADERVNPLIVPTSDLGITVTIGEGDEAKEYSLDALIYNGKAHFVGVKVINPYLVKTDKDGNVIDEGELVYTLKQAEEPTEGEPAAPTAVDYSIVVTGEDGEPVVLDDYSELKKTDAGTYFFTLATKAASERDTTVYSGHYTSNFKKYADDAASEGEHQYAPAETEEVVVQWTLGRREIDENNLKFTLIDNIYDGTAKQDVPDFRLELRKGKENAIEKELIEGLNYPAEAAETEGQGTENEGQGTQEPEQELPAADTKIETKFMRAEDYFGLWNKHDVGMESDPISYYGVLTSGDELNGEGMYSLNVFDLEAFSEDSEAQFELEENQKIKSIKVVKADKTADQAEGEQSVDKQDGALVITYTEGESEEIQTKTIALPDGCNWFIHVTEADPGKIIRIMSVPMFELDTVNEVLDTNLANPFVRYAEDKEKVLDQPTDAGTYIAQVEVTDSKNFQSKTMYTVVKIDKRAVEVKSTDVTKEFLGAPAELTATLSETDEENNTGIAANDSELPWEKLLQVVDANGNAVVDGWATKPVEDKDKDGVTDENYDAYEGYKLPVGEYKVVERSLSPETVKELGLDKIFTNYDFTVVDGKYTVKPYDLEAHKEDLTMTMVSSRLSPSAETHTVTETKYQVYDTESNEWVDYTGEGAPTTTCTYIPLLVARTQTDGVWGDWLIILGDGDYEQSFMNNNSQTYQFAYGYYRRNSEAGTWEEYFDIIGDETDNVEEGIIDGVEYRRRYKYLDKTVTPNKWARWMGTPEEFDEFIGFREIEEEVEVPNNPDEFDFTNGGKDGNLPGFDYDGYRHGVMVKENTDEEECFYVTFVKGTTGTTPDESVPAQKFLLSKKDYDLGGTYSGINARDTYAAQVIGKGNFTNVLEENWMIAPAENTIYVNEFSDKTDEMKADTIIAVYDGEEISWDVHEGEPESTDSETDPDTGSDIDPSSDIDPETETGSDDDSYDGSEEPQNDDSADFHIYTGEYLEPDVEVKFYKYIGSEEPETATAPEEEGGTGNGNDEPKPEETLADHKGELIEGVPSDVGKYVVEVIVTDLDNNYSPAQKTILRTLEITPMNVLMKPDLYLGNKDIDEEYLYTFGKKLPEVGDLYFAKGAEEDDADSWRISGEPFVYSDIYNVPEPESDNGEEWDNWDTEYSKALAAFKADLIACYDRELTYVGRKVDPETGKVNEEGEPTLLFSLNKEKLDALIESGKYPFLENYSIVGIEHMVNVKPVTIRKAHFDVDTVALNPTGATKISQAIKKVTFTIEGEKEPYELELGRDFEFVNDPTTGKEGTATIQIEGKGFFTGAADVDVEVKGMGTAKVAARSAELGQKLKLNLKFTLDDKIKADSNAYFTYEFKGKETTVKVSEMTPDSSGRYVIVVPIGSIDANKKVNVKLFSGEGVQIPIVDKDGTLVPETGYEYALIEYFDALTSAYPAGNKWNDLGVAAKDYCIAANNFLAEKPDGMSVSENVDKVDTDAIKSHKPVDSELITGLNSVKMSLECVSDTSLRIKFNFVSGVDITKYKCYIDESEATLYPGTANQYMAIISNIPARNLDDKHIIKLVYTDGNTTEEFTTTRSALSYAANILLSVDETAYPNYHVFAKALYAYNQATTNAFGKG